MMGNVLAPYSFTFQGGFPQGTDPESYGTAPPAPEGFYVSNTIGNDSNDGLSPSTPFLTILKGTQSATTPGDIVNIMAGTYSESSGKLWFAVPISIAALHAGTLANPIVFRAHLGDEGSVTIDGLGNNAGFGFRNLDYIHVKNLRFINNKTVGFVNPNVDERYYSNVLDTQKSTGGLIQGCYVNETDGVGGENIASIRCDNCVDLVIRNNYLGVLKQDGLIATTDHTSSVQAYHPKNITVENNTMIGGVNGILWKDHWLEDNDDALFESEIRYNHIEAAQYGVTSGTGNTEPLGSSYIHHNVLIAGGAGYQSGSIAATAGLPGGYIDLENNTIIVTSVGFGNTKAIFTDVGTTLDMLGNIVLGYTNANLNSNGNRTDLMVFNDLSYNIYDDATFRVTLTANGASPTVDYNSLAAWQAVLASSNAKLAQDNPDTNSITSNSATLFTSAGTGDYTNKIGSPAIGMMLDGSNAGAYQLGTETIGTTGGGAY